MQGRTTFSYLDDRNVLVEREVLTAHGWVGTAATVFYRNELPLDCELGVPEVPHSCQDNPCLPCAGCRSRA